jgi:hypothetical protein
MAKRFTDTEKWKKSLLRTIPPKYKLLWLYICDDCDHAGIWNVDIEVASIRIGEQIFLDEAVKILGEKIQIFDGGEKWFIQSFIDFQYGILNKENRVHLSIINILEKYNILKNKPLTSPLQGVKDKDKDKDKEMDKDSNDEILKINPENELLWVNIKNSFFNDFRWLEKFCRDKKITEQNLKLAMEEFTNDIELREDWKDLKELKSHFTNLFNKKNTINGKHKTTTVGREIEFDRP